MDLCAVPAAQLHYALPSSDASHSQYASCANLITGEVLASCLAASSPCRYSASQSDASGSSAGVVVCVAHNSSGQCDRDFMTDCSSTAATVAPDGTSASTDEASGLALDRISSPDGSADASTSATPAAGVSVDAPTLVGIIAGAIIVLGSIFFVAYVVRTRRPGARASGGRKSDSDTDFAGVGSSVADTDLSPQPRELSTIVLPMRPTLSRSSPGSAAAASSLHLPATSQPYARDESPVVRFPSQASFFRGSSAILTGRSVFSASVVNTGGAAVLAQRQLSSLFGPRASSASVVQPIHSRSTAGSERITSPLGSRTGRSRPLYSWETPMATALRVSDATDSSRTGRGRAESDANWSIGPGTASEAALADRPTAGVASRLSVALEAMSPSALPSSLHDVDALARSGGSEGFFDSGCTLFSVDSDFYGETIRDQSTAIYVGDEADKEIEF